MRRKAKENCTDTEKARLTLALGKRSSSAFANCEEPLLSRDFCRDATNHLHVKAAQQRSICFPGHLCKADSPASPRRTFCHSLTRRGGMTTSALTATAGILIGWKRSLKGVAGQVSAATAMGNISASVEIGLNYCGSSWSRPITRRQILPSFGDWDFFRSI